MPSAAYLFSSFKKHAEEMREKTCEKMSPSGWQLDMCVFSPRRQDGERPGCRVPTACVALLWVVAVVTQLRGRCLPRGGPACSCTHRLFSVLHKGLQLLLFNLSSPSLARWAYSKFVPKHSEPQFKQCFYEIVQDHKLRHFLFIAECLLGKLQVRTDFLFFSKTSRNETIKMSNGRLFPRRHRKQRTTAFLGSSQHSDLLLYQFSSQANH